MGLPGHRSLLMGDRSPLSRTVEEPESYVPSPVSPGAMGGAPWRGWTQDNIGRSDGPPRPSIAITRSSSSSTSNPTTLERELLVTPDTDAPWLTGRLTTEPETAGYGNSLHVPLGFSRPQSVVEDIRRRRLAAATRSRSGMAAATSPSSPQTPTPALSSGPETAMQRASRFANQSWLRPSVSPRVRRPVSISEETPHTPPISGTSTQPPGAPLDADSAATSFVRTAAERAGSPSPTRLSRSAEDRLLRIRAIRTEAARQSAAHSLSRPSMESLTSGSSSRRSGSLWRDILRPESRRSSAFDFMDFQDDTPDFPTFMETIIGGGLSALSPPPPGGLTSEEIAALPSSAYKDSEEAKKEERCPICLDDYEETSEVMGVPDCNHFFHKACLSQWLDRNRSCPYCRKNIPRRNNRRGTGSISGRHRHRPGPPPPPPPGPWSSGSSWRSSGSSGGPDASWGAGWA
ncbi:hypothetical protein FRB90_002153 [Tulasnella sp. 427]|nr:hypothetical protein FRB90_002153 [Tulasnella sp. 427]